MQLLQLRPPGRLTLTTATHVTNKLSATLFTCHEVKPHLGPTAPKAAAEPMGMSAVGPNRHSKVDLAQIKANMMTENIIATAPPKSQKKRL